jgi:hypothetical protein
MQTIFSCSPAQEPFFPQTQEFIITPWGLSGVQNVNQSNIPHLTPIYTLYRGQNVPKILNYCWGIYSPHVTPNKIF